MNTNPENLRENAGVSEECMNRVYDMLKTLDTDWLKRMWEEANPYTPQGALIRHQINYTLWKRFKV